MAEINKFWWWILAVMVTCFTVLFAFGVKNT